MNTKINFVFSLAMTGLLFGCGGESLPSDDAAAGNGGAGNALSREEVDSLDKADWPTDYCETYGWYGDGEICDDFCPLPDPDCAAPCASIGGTCMADPGDPTFPALCENLGLKTVEGACAAFNRACCAPVEPPPPPESCEQQGGTCMSDPGDPTFPALCENLGLETIEGGCAAFNEACCAPVEPPPPPESCEQQGGTCMSDPGDPGFPALCENLGLETIEGGCAAFNEACCAPVEPPPPPESCEQQGGTCMSDPGDPGFAANCESLGLISSPATCVAFNQACCLPVPPDPSNCASMGGVCMSDPGDPGFAANCEDLGMQTLPGECPAFNHACCQLQD